VLKVLSQREYLEYVTAGMLYFSFAGLGFSSGFGMKAIEGRRRFEQRRVAHMTFMNLRDEGD
jgi:hypothetical protein